VAILERGVLRAEGKIAELLRQPDAVSFEVEGLDEPSAAAVRAELETRTGRRVRQEYPAMSLERYFLQVVAQDGRQRAFAIAPFLNTPPPPNSSLLPPNSSLP